MCFNDKSNHAFQVEKNRSSEKTAKKKSSKKKVKKRGRPREGPSSFSLKILPRYAEALVPAYKYLCVRF
jgi:hypothetical protein